MSRQLPDQSSPALPLTPAAVEFEARKTSSSIAPQCITYREPNGVEQARLSFFESSIFVVIGFLAVNEKEKTRRCQGVLFNKIFSITQTIASLEHRLRNSYNRAFVGVDRQISPAEIASVGRSPMLLYHATPRESILSSHCF